MSGPFRVTDVVRILDRARFPVEGVPVIEAAVDRLRDRVIGQAADAGIPVTEIAARLGVTRQAVYARLRRQAEADIRATIDAMNAEHREEGRRGH